MTKSPNPGLVLVAGVLALLAAAGAPAGSGRAVGTQGFDLFGAGSLVGSGQSGASFGGPVRISTDGRVAIVGGGGAAWIFVRSGPTWREALKLTPPSGGPVVGFGAAVALSANGRTAVVGAPGIPFLSAASKPKRGFAWVFTTTSTVRWIGSKRVSLLPARGVNESSGFGRTASISADGSTVVVGGPDDNGAKGAAWVFRRSGSGWKQNARLTGKRLEGRARFGASVAIAGDGKTLLVGGPANDAERGAVWVFTRKGSGWKEQAKLSPRIVYFELPAGKAAFGSSLALFGDGRTALIGAPAVETATGSGVVFIARRSASGWSGGRIPRPTEPVSAQERAFDKKQPYRFGTSIALSGDQETLLIGGPRQSNGAAWIYRRGTSPAVPGYRFERPRLKHVTGAGSFGSSVAVSENGDVALVGSVPGPGRMERSVAVFARIPVVTDVAPDNGPTSGGTQVTIRGTSFENVGSVTFGSKPAASFAVDSATKIRAASPPGAGTVQIKVTNDLGTSVKGSPAPCVPLVPCVPGASGSDFTYVAPPEVSALTPASGPAAGGTEVRLTGTSFRDVTAVRFGGVAATSFRVDSPTRITAVSPPREPGTVTVGVRTRFGTSAAGAGAQFTYVAQETVIAFDELVTGGPGQALLTVNSQYAAQGVTFNDLSAIDYAKGTAPLPGFARSGSVGLEPCIGMELCTVPIRASFSAPKRLVRVWVGISGPLGQTVQVRLTALTAAGSVVGTASATLPASTTATPIRTPLEVSTGSPAIAQLEITIPGGTNNGLAIDDVTFAA